MELLNRRHLELAWGGHTDPPTKARPSPGGGGGGGLPPSLPEQPDGADSNDYSTASESGGGCRHQ